MTYQNVETADIGWIKDSVSRWAQPIEAVVSKVLLPRGQRARFDWAGRLRTDQKTQVEVVTPLRRGRVSGRSTRAGRPSATRRGTWPVDEGTTAREPRTLGAKETA